MKKLILTVGLPLSGKSTWAKQQGCPIVNPDSIRLALHGKPYIPETESMVWAIAQYMVKVLFLVGHDLVIVDATNTSKKRRDFWKPYNDEWDIVYKHIKTSKEECIIRARNTNREDLIPVIERMAENFDMEGIE